MKLKWKCDQPSLTRQRQDLADDFQYFADLLASHIATGVVAQAAVGLSVDRLPVRSNVVRPGLDNRTSEG
jgi:hypothetical protein